MFQEFLVNKKRLPAIELPEDAWNTFSDLAKGEGKTFSQAVRDAMQEYVAKRGHTIDFNLGGWGGKRGRDTATDQGDE